MAYLASLMKVDQLIQKLRGTHARARAHECTHRSTMISETRRKQAV